MLKEKVQKLGKFLSGMVMPNIGAFIAWGFITALFIASGWFPNEELATIVDPMLKYLLPVLVGYTGGKVVADTRGGVIGAIATFGVIMGADIPMFIGAMIMGPLAGYVIKKFDKAAQGKVPAGFEMLVNNFSVGILGMLLAILGFYAVGPAVATVTNILKGGVEIVVNKGLLPLSAIFIEPAKVLFLNNAIGNGILVPLGIQQASTAGKSVLFLLESNPGPGLGILLAFMFFGKGSAKGSAPGAAIIHFFGGIHEIYFPYILMKPALILAAIAGGVSGTFTFQLLGAGLKAAASPGSIIAILLMTPKGSYLAVLSGVFVAAVVSFLVASVILKHDKSTGDDLAEKQAEMEAMKAESKGKEMPSSQAAQDSVDSYADVKKIIFACDAGMGSSAMGASLLRDKVKKAGIKDISVTNTAVNRLKDEQGLLVVTQEELAERALQRTPSAMHVSVDNFLSSPKYDEIVANLKALSQIQDKPQATENTVKTAEAGDLGNVDFTKVEEVNFIRHDQHIGTVTMATSLFSDSMKKANKQTPIKAVRINELEDSDKHLVIVTAAAKKNLAVRYTDIQTVVVDDLLTDKKLQDVVAKLK